MDMEALTVRVKRLVNKPVTTYADDTGKPKNAEILEVLNETRYEVYSDLAAALPDRWAAYTTLSYTADSTSIQLPSAARHTSIMRVWTTTSETNLIPLRFDEFGGYQATGIPSGFAIGAGTYIYLRPVPTQDVTLNITYLPSLTALSATTDTPSELPGGFHHVIALGAASRILATYGDPSDNIKQEYARTFEKLVAQIERMVNDNHIRENSGMLY